MPLFATFVGSIFGALSTWLVGLLGARVALRVAAIATLAGLAVALLAFFNGVVAPMAGAAFSTSYGQLIGLAFPPAAGTCLAAIAAVWAGCVTYRLQVQAVKITANI